jgi:hypothetical protein
LISQQEHEAWDVLLACQGQLRLAPSGHATGIDMDTALRLGAARGSDLAVLAELVPAAEADFVEALKLEQRHQRPVVPTAVIAIRSSSFHIMRRRAIVLAAYLVLAPVRQRELTTASGHMLGGVNPERR